MLSDRLDNSFIQYMWKSFAQCGDPQIYGIAMEIAETERLLKTGYFKNVDFEKDLMGDYYQGEAEQA